MRVSRKLLMTILGSAMVGAVLQRFLGCSLYMGLTVGTPRDSIGWDDTLTEGDSLPWYEKLKEQDRRNQRQLGLPEQLEDKGASKWTRKLPGGGKPDPLLILEERQGKDDALGLGKAKASDVSSLDGRHQELADLRTKSGTGLKVPDGTAERVDDAKYLQVLNNIKDRAQKADEHGDMEEVDVYGKPSQPQRVPPRDAGKLIGLREMVQHQKARWQLAFGMLSNGKAQPAELAALKGASRRQWEALMRIQKRIEDAGGAISMETSNYEPTWTVKRGGGYPSLGAELPLQPSLGVLAEWDVPAVPTPFHVNELELDPAKRQTGLPLSAASWTSQNVFVISVQSRKAAPRSTLLHLDSILSAVGINYTHVLAPASLANETLARYEPLRPANDSKRWPMKEHVTALGLAHAEVWAHVAAERLPYALVFEDDAVFNKGADAWRSQFEQGLHQLNLITMQSGRAAAFDLFLLSRQALAPFGEYEITRNVVRAQASRGTHAYMVSLQGASKLLRELYLDRPLNEAIWSVPQLEVLALEPPLGMALQYTCASHGEPCRNPLPVETVRSPLKACVSVHLAGKLPPTSPAWVVNASNPLCQTTLLCLLHNATSGARLPSEPAALPPGANSIYLTMPPKLHMWPVFVINLESERGRFDTLRDELALHGFGNVTRALAVQVANGQALGGGPTLDRWRHIVAEDHRAYTRNRFIKNSDRFLSAGEAGCALSHYMVWSEIVARRTPYALVLEDDVELSPGFAASFERAIAEANEVATGATPRRCQVLLLGRMGVVSKWIQPHVSEHLVETSFSWCTFAYIITLQGARRLVERFYFNDPIDAMWWRVPGVSFWSVRPLLASHRSGNKDSNISSSVQAAALRGTVKWRK